MSYGQGGRGERLVEIYAEIPAAFQVNCNDIETYSYRKSHSGEATVRSILVECIYCSRNEGYYHYGLENEPL